MRKKVKKQRIQGHVMEELVKLMKPGKTHSERFAARLADFDGDLLPLYRKASKTVRKRLPLHGVGVLVALKGPTEQLIDDLVLWCDDGM
jgi:hypothetical protein